jgi:hypothetical protein
VIDSQFSFAIPVNHCSGTGRQSIPWVEPNRNLLIQEEETNLKLSAHHYNSLSELICQLIGDLQIMVDILDIIIILKNSINFITFLAVSITSDFVVFGILFRPRIIRLNSQFIKLPVHTSKIPMAHVIVSVSSSSRNPELLRQ